MSPFTVVVILLLTVLFIVLSLIPFMSGDQDMDSFEHPVQPQAKTAH
jgi:hypothetical protein